MDFYKQLTDSYIYSLGIRKAEDKALFTEGMILACKENPEWEPYEMHRECERQANQILGITKVYYHSLWILTWHRPYESLKFFYPDARNLLVIVEYSFTPAIPSASRYPDRWNNAFSRIEEVDVNDPELTQKVKTILHSSTGPWVLLCTDDYEANKKLLEDIKLSSVSHCSTYLYPK